MLNATHPLQTENSPSVVKAGCMRRPTVAWVQKAPCPGGPGERQSDELRFRSLSSLGGFSKPYLDTV